jgi:hypothetical protein
MAGFEVITYGRFWVIAEASPENLVAHLKTANKEAVRDGNPLI